MTTVSSLDLGGDLKHQELQPASRQWANRHAFSKTNQAAFQVDPRQDCSGGWIIVINSEPLQYVVLNHIWLQLDITIEIEWYQPISAICDYYMMFIFGMSLFFLVPQFGQRILNKATGHVDRTMLSPSAASSPARPVLLAIRISQGTAAILLGLAAGRGIPWGNICHRFWSYIFWGGGFFFWKWGNYWNLLNTYGKS